MRVRVSDSAELDAQAVERRLESEHPGYGTQFTDLFEQALRAVEASPQMYGRTEDGPDDVETREFYIQRFEYRVIYGFVSDDLAEVIAVVHARQRPGAWVRRIPRWN
jgi:plasmid stabilization system protein ParE